MTLLLFLTACASTITRDPGAADAEIEAPDAGRDAGRVEPIDPPDPELQLGRTLRCELDDEAALAAVVRWVACTPDETTTVRGLFEAWEAGLYAAVEENGGFTGGSALEIPCDGWRCIAEARSCEEASRCIEEAYAGAACEPRTRSCDGSRVTRCASDGRGSAELIDCADFGATCSEGQCRLGECVFSEGYYHLDCDGDDLVLCEGAVRMSCDAWQSGARCGRFAIGGEVPTAWCSRSDESVAGAYDFPVSCESSGTIRFESVSTDAFSYDCLANGYRGCTERGCSE
jgi:hypothetical protein